MKFLSNTFFFFTLLPFVSLIALPTDVQPISFLLGLLIILILALKNELIISKIDVYIIFLAILSYVYISYEAKDLYENGFTSANTAIRRQVGMTFVFVIYVASKNVFKNFNVKILFFVTFIQTLFTILNLALPAIYNFFAIRFLRTVKIDFTEYDGFRGASGLTAEPAYLSGSALAYFALAALFLKKKEISNKYFLIITILCIFMLLMSKSAIGLVFIVGIILYLIFDFINFKYIFLCTLAFLILYNFIPQTFYDNLRYNSFVENSRGLRLAQKATESGVDRFLSDASLKDKITPVYIGFLSLGQAPFGGGIGYFPIAANKNLDSVINNIDGCRTADIANDGSKTYTCVTKSPSAFGLYATEFGYLFIFFICLIMLKSDNYFYLSLFIKGSALIFIISSMSITFPLTWLLIASIQHDNKTYNKLIN